MWTGGKFYTQAMLWARTAGHQSSLPQPTMAKGYQELDRWNENKWMNEQHICVQLLQWTAITLHYRNHVLECLLTDKFSVKIRNTMPWSLVKITWYFRRIHFLNFTWIPWFSVYWYLFCYIWMWIPGQVWNFSLQKGASSCYRWRKQSLNTAGSWRYTE
jgi:hypothetical protein